ncbi:MAG: hypothetical protein A2Y69_15520 [Candidatus Aminicenantes bacterium RBG_13_59_9]|nr:MAG: hypothetical protein A2Y69_15520 [Candidatus Aminicenantes bacterium RBG_13_59_9]
MASGKRPASARSCRKRAESEIGRLNAELEKRIAGSSAQLETANRDLASGIKELSLSQEILLRRNRELSVLYAISRAATQSLELEEILQRTLEATLEALEVEVGGIYLLESDGKSLTLRAVRGVSDQTIENVRHVKWGEGLSGRAVAEKKPVVQDVKDYPSKRLAPSIIKENLKSLASIPLLSGGQVVGAMNISARRARAFPPEELELLAAIGQQLGISVQKARLYEASQHELAERKQVEEALGERTKQLELANQELKSFTHSVSHDLRAPLRVIDGFSVALVEDYEKILPADAQNHLARIRGGVRRMSELIDALLVLSSVSKAEIIRQSVDMSGLAQAVSERLIRTQPDREVEWRIENGLTVVGDSRLLSLVMENLIDNAWKFTSKTDRASIEFGARLQPDGQSVFYVKDNGAGFDMAYADKLGVDFQRLHSVAEFPGTGIGLSTVQRIIRRHDGRVWAEGEVGRGATFYFTLWQRRSHDE